MTIDTEKIKQGEHHEYNFREKQMSTIEVINELDDIQKVLFSDINDNSVYSDLVISIDFNRKKS